MGCHLYEADYGLHHVADLLRFDLRQVLAYVQTGGGTKSFLCTFYHHYLQVILVSEIIIFVIRVIAIVPIIN